MSAAVDTQDLEAKVKDMYRHVAQRPDDPFHFELGTPLPCASGTTRTGSRPYLAVPSSRSPVSGTSSTWPTSSRERVSSTSGAARAPWAGRRLI
jgi:hypothetical protein